MNCTQCGANNTDGKNFCADCGTLLTSQLIPVINTQIEKYVKDNLKDRDLVDVQTTEAIAERFLKWGKWFLVPLTILLSVLAAILTFFGIRDVTDVHKAAQQAITESNAATKTAADASTKAQEAEAKAVAATKMIDEATARLAEQVNKANTSSKNAMGVEQKFEGEIADARKHVDDRVVGLDASVKKANEAIAAQQATLTDTNQLLKKLFSQGQVETFATSKGNLPNYAVYSFPSSPQTPQQQRGALVFMLLKAAPIYQTLQINFRIYVQPKSSYQIDGNLVRFFWGDPADGLKQFPLEVSYVPDPTYKGVVYSKLSVKDGHIYADDKEVLNIVVQQPK